jgi:hypothetical protein
MAIPELKDAKERLTDCIYFGDPLSASVGTGFVPTNRQINTTSPLSGGGDLSTNRTLTVDSFAGTTAGAVPASLGGTTNFLRADGSWAAPAVFTNVANGYAPASGGGTTNYLRADGTWAAPPGAGIAGLTIGFYPVATGATSIGNGRVLQGTDYLQFFTSFSDSSNYESALLAYTPASTLFTFYPAKTVAGVGQDCALKLQAGGTGTAAITMSGATTSITGRIAFDQTTLSAVNGANTDFDISTAGTNVRLIGPTAAFSIGGLTPTGGIVTIYNTTDQIWTILNEDPLSTAANRIFTLKRADVDLPATGSSATFQYSVADSRWILIATNPPAREKLTTNTVPIQGSAGILTNSAITYDGSANFGVSTSTRTAKWTVNGTVAVPLYAQILANGLNSDLPAPTTSLMRVSGPTGAFSIGGLATVTSENGKRIAIINSTSQAMTIVHEDASSTAAYRISTPTGANVVYPAASGTIELVYDSMTARWRLIGAQQIGYGSAGAVQVASATGSQVAATGLTWATGTLAMNGGGTGIELNSDGASRTLNLGTPAATVYDYALRGHRARGGTDSNVAGGDLSIGGGAGTGTAGGGDTSIVTAYPGLTGNTQNSFSSRHVYAAKPVTLTAATATTVLTVGVPTETGSGGTLRYTLYATDGTDMQIRRGRIEWGAVNTAGTMTVVLGTPEEVDCTPTGTLTVTVTALDNGDDTFSFQFDAASSLTETTLETWISLEHDGKGAVTTV